MKKVGIITMHKVFNHGSALQAYATQCVLKKLGVEAEIIDYIFPNKFHKEKKSIKDVLHTFLSEIISGFPQKKQQKHFNIFYKKHFKLSKQTYNSPAEIHRNPPKYDIYMVGSDQTWCLLHNRGDKTFFLSFAPKGAKKISYASSFGPYSLCDLQQIKNELHDFTALSVRERSGQNVIKELLQKDAQICLDPTLLLNNKEWSKLASQSQLQIKKPFVLVYILTYAYNPYPFVTQFIENAYKQTGLHLVLLHYSPSQPLSIKDVTSLNNGVSPCDFLYLFQNASLVITTSFHGTAFALNFERPFYSIINDKSTSDDRMLSLLQEVGAEDRAILCNSEISDISLTMDYTSISKKLEEKRKKSITYLSCNII
ncbi:MAG: polysaccharide pyruvyl transferase family protein [Bacteroidales bacterium]|jgi:polysaccharide pyruvyl transferase WcaK-like protein|nr:polysaccharide pyruvyl transferase family protein [Bacteroidales bacterium]